MAKFRRSNVSSGRRSSQSFMSRLVIICLLALFAVFYLVQKLVPFFDEIESGNKVVETSLDRYYLPTGSKGQIVNHEYYSLSYNEKWEQAEWVAYKLSADNLKKPRYKGNKRFNADYDINTRSAFHRDYTHSGYTRGHLAPAADMSFNEVAYKECYYMSNISPQIRPFNNGIWRELEETIRNWAMKEKELFIVTGPIVNNTAKSLGENRVKVPESFYKIILDVHGSEKKALAFLIPHEKSEKHLREYAISIDQLEKKLGYDFFSDLLEDWEEDDLESDVRLSNWKFDQGKFNDRVKYWNNQ